MFFVQNQSIPSVKRVISQESFNLEYVVLFLEENKIINDKVKNIELIPKILNELIDEWNKIFDVKGESVLEEFGAAVGDKQEVGIRHEEKNQI